MGEMFVSNAEGIHSMAFSHAPTQRWPLAGAKLTPELRTAFGIPEGEEPQRIHVKNTRHDYLVTNGYLIPYYAPSKDRFDRTRLAERNEELIIDRCRSFINNAQPELGVIRTKQQIDEAIGYFLQMPEDTHQQCAEKAGQFKMIVGAIVTRFETLGRAINQRNAQGIKLEYADILRVRKIPDARIDDLRKEFRDYYQVLQNEQLLPLWRTILLTDMKVDHDGLLIDLMREIGKPLRASTEKTEDFVRGGIILKIGHAIESIDTVHTEMRKLMTSGKTAELFEGSVQRFIEENGERCGVKNVRDIVGKLDEFAALCRARASIRGDDSAYDEVFRQKSALNGMFNGTNGLLQSMRRVGRGSSVEVQELRDILTQGFKIMTRTANTRTPSNEFAPEVFIPSMEESATPMQRFATNQLLNDHEQAHAREVYKRVEKNHLSGAEKEAYLRRSFSSVGLLRGDIDQLKETLRCSRAHSR